MKQPASVFIMDVTNSSSEGNWKEITTHLQEWEYYITKWCKEILPSKVTHRRGDEILFVGNHHFTAYTVAYHISQHWKYTKQKPYFGLSYGFIDENIENIDIEIWNHPLVKEARRANEKIKNEKNRVTNMYFGSEEKGELQNIISTTDILNLLVENQQALVQNQSENQKLIYSLYSIFNEQKQIAKLLDRTQSTISTHFKRGNCELLYKTHYKIQKILSVYGVDESVNLNHTLLLIDNLNNSIRNSLKESLSNLYSNL
ncbi:MAG: hypothetical protein ACQEWV_12885 [Bacillota bacterium]